jgi:hypothetical protein
MDQQHCGVSNKKGEIKKRKHLQEVYTSSCAENKGYERSDFLCRTIL